MCTSPQLAVKHAARTAAQHSAAELWAERTYQVLTIAAVLWILEVVWLFGKAVDRTRNRLALNRSVRA